MSLKFICQKTSFIDALKDKFVKYSVELALYMLSFGTYLGFKDTN